MQRVWHKVVNIKRKSSQMSQIYAPRSVPSYGFETRRQKLLQKWKTYIKRFGDVLGLAKSPGHDRVKIIHNLLTTSKFTEQTLHASHHLMFTCGGFIV